ncbi:MAG: glycine/sarcosine/betaine reductase selenoprotein B family protein [Bacillota bacterium]
MPKGNPDRLQSASAQKWCKYDVSCKDALSQETGLGCLDKFCTVHIRVSWCQ